MSEQRLRGRVAIVTGASRGIGREIALALGREGATVVLAARTDQPDDGPPGTVHDAADAVRAAGSRALAVVCDVTVDDDLRRLVDAATEVGAVDILINNAAVTVPGRPGRRAPRPVARSPELPGVVDLPLRSVRRQFEANLFAAWRLIQLVLPGMIAHGRGAIVNVSSEAARQPPPGPYGPRGSRLPLAYGVSKLALEHLTRAVAYEVAGTGIAINALAPSLPVPTPGLEWMGMPFDRVVSAQSVADATVELVLADPATATGLTFHSEDVLHPELGRRGWLGTSP